MSAFADGGKQRAGNSHAAQIIIGTEGVTLERQLAASERTRSCDVSCDAKEDILI